MSILLSTSEFWEKLDLLAGGTEFELMQLQKASTDGAGNSLVSRYGSPKWRAEFEVAPAYHADAAEVEAMFKRLIGRNGRFLAYDTRRPFPAADPFGTIIGASTVTVKSKGADNRSIALEGLPAGYVVSIGDKLSISYGTGKIFLAEAMVTLVADGTGGTGEFEIQPFLPPDVAVGNAVSFSKPCAKFEIVPGSYRAARAQSRVTSGISFAMRSVP